MSKKKIHLLTYAVSRASTEGDVSVGMTISAVLRQKPVGFEAFRIRPEVGISVRIEQVHGYVRVGGYESMFCNSIELVINVQLINRRVLG